MDKATTTKKRAGIYTIVGIIITLFNFTFYSVLANLIINNNDYLWLSNLISTVVTIVVAYCLHSRITWKERPITKTAIYKFFAWNILFAIFVGPLFTQLFSLLTPLYDLAYSITTAIHLDFSYEFIQSTGAFVLTSLVVMILNFLFYDKFVFGKTSHKLKEETS